MMTKYFFVPAILGFASLLFAPDAAIAQKGRGGPGRSTNFSPARVSGASMAARSTSAYRGGAYYHNGSVYHNGNYYHNGYNYGARYPGYGFGFGIGLYAPFYPSAYAWDAGMAPRVAFYPSSIVVQGQQSIPDGPSAQDAPMNAQINVLLPDPNAKVWFDGSPTTSTGTERLYHTPDLSTSVTNTYRIRATWLVNGKEITQERVVGVAAGRGTVVDFTRPASEGVPPPPAKE
jgi:uncharacterized protein (TIGR03000 family)